MRSKLAIITIFCLALAGQAMAQGIGLGNWDAAYEADPLETDTVDQGAGEIRELKSSIFERWDVEHCWGTAGGGCAGADTGIHREGSAMAFTSSDCSAESVDSAREDGWLCLEVDGSDVGLWAWVASAWLKVGGFASGTVIAFDHANQCPDGFEEYTEFDGIMLRGRDISDDDPVGDIPEDGNEECIGTGAGNPKCGAALFGKYSDSIRTNQLPSHDHTFDMKNTSSINPQTRTGTAAVSGTGATNPEPQIGGNEPHYHPFRTTLFCRRK